MLFFFFKQKTAYEVRISDWSSDVCSSDRERRRRLGAARAGLAGAPCGAAVLLQPGGAQPTDAVAVDQLLPGLQLLERQVPPLATIGRASCRERVCQYVLISEVAVSYKKKIDISLHSYVYLTY